jgi:hypothetical protein
MMTTPNICLVAARMISMMENITNNIPLNEINCWTMGSIDPPFCFCFLIYIITILKISQHICLQICIIKYIFDIAIIPPTDHTHTHKTQMHLNGCMNRMVTITLGLDSSAGNTKRRHSTNPLGVNSSSQLGIRTQKDTYRRTKPSLFVSTAGGLVNDRRGISCHFRTTHVNHFILYQKKKRQRTL